MLFAGCKDDGADDGTNGDNREEQPNGSETVLDISVSTLTLDNGGNAKTFSIVANGEWTLTNGSSWCKTDKTGGKGNAVVSVMAFPHEEYDDRSSNLTIKSGKKSKVLTVTQKKKDALLLTEEKYTLGQEGDTITVEVKSNLTYSVTIPSAYRDWIKEVSTPATKALTTAYKHFEIAPNPANDAREGIIVFKDNGSSLADTVRIFQARREELILLQDRHFLTASAQTLSVDLQTNVDYEVIIPDTVSDWITLSASPAVEKADVLRLDITANTTRNERSGKVVVADRNGTLSDTLYITQESNVWKGKGLYVPGIENTVSSYQLGFYNFNSTNCEVTVPDSVQWVQYDAGNHCWKINSNETGHHREAFIMIRNKNTQVRDTSRICQCIKPFNSVEIVKNNDNILYEEVSTSINLNMPRDANRIRIPRTNGIKWSRVLEEGTERNVKIEETGSYIECYDFSGSFKLKFRFEYDHEYDDEKKCNIYTTATFIRDMESELTYNDDITFTSVQEIKDFVAQGYNKVTKTITIEINDPDFTDLSAFADHQIKKIYGLEIKCPHLQSFQGIAGLEEISGLTITCPNLQSFQGMAGLRKIGGLTITCPNLKSFQGMTDLKEIGGLYLEGNYPYLMSFSGLESLDSLTYLEVGYGTFRYLTTFQGLNGIKTLKRIKLYGNFPSLKSFEGLENVTIVSSGYSETCMHLSGTFNALTSFQGLNNVKSIKGLQIDGTFPVLTSLHGLENLTTINGDFVIGGKFDNLVDFKGLGNLKRIERTFHVYTSHVGEYFNLKNFSGLEKLEYIGGTFEIQGNLPLLKSLEGLNNLREIGGRLNIGGYSGSYEHIPPQFSGETLKGLNNLTSVAKDITIYDCKNLTTLEGLNSLSYAGGRVYISTCPNLLSLEGLNSLKTVEETVTIRNCYELLSIDGLSGLQTFPNALNGAKVLKIQNCSKLKNFCGLSDDFLRYYDLEVTKCGYNPTRAALLNGNCSQ